MPDRAAASKKEENLALSQVQQPRTWRRGPALHLRPRPLPPPGGPPGAPRTRPADPGVGPVYRLRRVVPRGSGLPRAQSRSRLALLIRCHRRHRRWARRAAGIALHRPPWPSPPPSASAKGQAPCRHSHRRRRYRVPRAPARGAPGSHRHQWPAPPWALPQHVTGYPRPRRVIIRGKEPVPRPVEAALLYHWGASQKRQLSHDLAKGRWACKRCT